MTRRLPTRAVTPNEIDFMLRGHRVAEVEAYGDRITLTLDDGRTFGVAVAQPGAPKTNDPVPTLVYYEVLP